MKTCGKREVRKLTIDTTILFAMLEPVVEDIVILIYVIKLLATPLSLMTWGLWLGAIEFLGFGVALLLIVRYPDLETRAIVILNSTLITVLIIALLYIAIPYLLDGLIIPVRYVSYYASLALVTISAPIIEKLIRKGSILEYLFTKINSKLGVSVPFIIFLVGFVIDFIIGLNFEVKCIRIELEKLTAITLIAVATLLSRAVFISGIVVRSREVMQEIENYVLGPYFILLAFLIITNPTHLPLATIYCIIALLYILLRRRFNNIRRRKHYRLTTWCIFK